MGVRHTETSLIVWSGAVASPDEVLAEVAASTEPIASVFGADSLYDAGDKGCASGPMDEIAALVRDMEAGQTLEIRATDPSVAADLGAWCRMTGHTLIEQRGDRYLVKHK